MQVKKLNQVLVGDQSLQTEISWRPRVPGADYGYFWVVASYAGILHLVRSGTYSATPNAPEEFQAAYNDPRSSWAIWLDGVRVVLGSEEDEGPHTWPDGVADLLHSIATYDIPAPTYGDLFRGAPWVPAPGTGPFDDQ